MELGTPGKSLELQGLLSQIRDDLSQAANHRRSIKATRRQEKARERRFHPDPDEWRKALAVLVDAGISDITIGYWRISTALQADGEGPESQQQSVIAFSTANTDRGVDLWVYDIDSGREESRLGLDFLIEAMKSGRVKRIVVQKLDRLARNNFLAEKVQQAAFQARTQLCSATEHIPDGPVGTLFRQILQAFAQYEASIIVWRMNSGKMTKVKRDGTYNGGEVPYGYLAAGKGHLLLCEPEARIVRLIFDLYARGYGQSAIADFLNRSGIPTRMKGEMGWRQGQIRRILERESAYRAESLFSKKVKDFERVAHEPILPCRPEEEKQPDLLGSVKTDPRARIPDSLLFDQPDFHPIPGTVQKLTPDQALSMKALFALSEAGFSIEAACRELNRRGLKTLTGRKWKWSNAQQHLARRALYARAIEAADAGDVQIHVDEGEAVSRILDLRRQGLSYPRIQIVLEQEGTKTLRGAAWSISSIQRVCTGRKRQAA